jgi:hypothetical protein
MCVFVNPQFKLIKLEPAEIPLNVIILKYEIGDLERPRSTGDDLKIIICGYSVYHEDEVR